MLTVPYFRHLWVSSTRKRKTRRMSSSAFVPLRDLAHTPVAHLFCFHHAGGAATAFKEWSRDLRDDFAVTATVLPGRGRRFGQPMHPTLEDAAAEVADALVADWPGDVPIVLFGHSLGGLMAYEVCRRVEEKGRQPARVVVSAVAPDRPEGQKRYEWSDAQLRQLLSEMGGTPSEVLEHEDLMALCIPILRADLQLVDAYDPSQYGPVRAPMTVVGGKRDRSAERPRLEKWRDYTLGDFEVVMFPGGHFYIEEHRRDVTSWLEDHLAGTLSLP
jgi:surfactin synthase thioesterase subunit